MRIQFQRKEQILLFIIDPSTEQRNVTLCYKNNASQSSLSA